MTDLEFIEKEIERYKIIKIGVVAMLKEPNRTEATISFLKNDLKEYEEKINHLQQIKAKLEALKLIKDKLILSIEKETNCFDEQDITGCWLVQGDIVKGYTIIELNEYQTLKKALEVEDDK